MRKIETENMSGMALSARLSAAIVGAIKMACIFSLFSIARYHASDEGAFSCHEYRYYYFDTLVPPAAYLCHEPFTFRHSNFCFMTTAISMPQQKTLRREMFLYSYISSRLLLQHLLKISLRLFLFR